MLAVTAFVLLVYAYSLLSRRLEGTVLTILLVFSVAGKGRLLHMFVFFLFGASAGSALGEFHLAPVLDAILSLTLVRMLPVAISMIGTRLSAASVLFMGWFGPRGLGSIVLRLVATQEVHAAGTSLMRLGWIATVLLSLFAHGLSASPGNRLYAQRIARLGADAPEYEAVQEIPKA